MNLVKTWANRLTPGTVFYLTEDGKFRDLWKEWHGTQTRPEVDPITGQPTGKSVTLLVYTGEYDYKDTIREGAEVWIPAGNPESLDEYYERTK